MLQWTVRRLGVCVWDIYISCLELFQFTNFLLILNISFLRALRRLIKFAAQLGGSHQVGGIRLRSTSTALWFFLYLTAFVSSVRWLLVIYAWAVRSRPASLNVTACLVLIVPLSRRIFSMHVTDDRSMALTRFSVLSLLGSNVSLVLRVWLKLLFAVVNLVLHQVIDPQTHLNVVLQHHHDHTVQSESQVVFLNWELL